MTKRNINTGIHRFFGPNNGFRKNNKKGKVNHMRTKPHEAPKKQLKNPLSEYSLETSFMDRSSQLTTPNL